VEKEIFETNTSSILRQPHAAPLLGSGRQKKEIINFVSGFNHFEFHHIKALQKAHLVLV
jgi:hypothetical protein